MTLRARKPNHSQVWKASEACKQSFLYPYISLHSSTVETEKKRRGKFHLNEIHPSTFREFKNFIIVDVNIPWLTPRVSTNSV